MAAKKKVNKVKKATKAKAPMQVVSLKNVLSLLDTTKNRISARKMTRKNPLRHFPKIEGLGRPEKERAFQMTTVLGNGQIAQKTVRTTKSRAYAQANRMLTKRFNGSQVKEIMVDDGR